MIKTALKRALIAVELPQKVAIDYGFTKTELSGYKKGIRAISLEKALLLSKIYGVDEDFTKYLKYEMDNFISSQNL
jgi:transcriptional regulator with XRE-family HTH domain